MFRRKERRRCGRSEFDGVPLALLPSGTEATVIRVEGGRGLVGRLCELGFVEGAKVRTLVSSGPGPILVEVKNSRIGLGRGAAMRVFVREEGWQ